MLGNTAAAAVTNLSTPSAQIPTTRDNNIKGNPTAANTTTEGNQKNAQQGKRKLDPKGNNADMSEIMCRQRQGESLRCKTQRHSITTQTKKRLPHIGE